MVVGLNHVGPCAAVCKISPTTVTVWNETQNFFF